MESADSLIQDRIRYLRENTDFVSAVFDSLIGYAIVAADFDGNIIAYNEGAHQIYGYAPEEVIGRENINIFFPEEFIAAGRFEGVVSELIEKGRVSFEGEMVRKDGSRFPAHKLFTLTRDKSGQIVGFVAIVQDQTLQKQIEAITKESEARFRLIIESNADGMLIVDKEGIICFVNPAAEALLVRPKNELLGSYLGFPTTSGERTEIEIVRPVSCGLAAAEMRVADIEWQGQKSYLATLRDITERQQTIQQIKASLVEKELLLKEIHHRVKNNLQIISSLLKLQTRYTGDEKVLEIFRDSQNRVNTMASVHSLLYNSENFTSINFGEYIRDTAKQLFRSYNTNPRIISLQIMAEDCMLSIDTAMPCGLMINELISNALKHAFPKGRGGEIRIEINKVDNDIRIVFEDKGIGFPKNLDFQKTETMGMHLVNMLVKQLNGSIELTRNGGTRFVIMFKAKNTQGE